MPRWTSEDWDNIINSQYKVIDQNTIGAYKQTNADRIRAMTDEELATVMMCPNENGLAEIECDRDDSCNCYECLLKWLQSEVEEK